MKWKRKCALLVLFTGLVLAFPDPCLGEKGKQEPASVVEDESLAEVKVELEALFARIQESKLPAKLFEAKAREGIVKKVPAKKILAALVTLEKRCVTASTLLSKAGLKATEPNIELAVSLLAAGLNEAQLEKLLEGISAGKLDPSYDEKALLIALVLTETGGNGPGAVTTVVDLVKTRGQKGIDTWFEKNKGSKKGKKPGKAKGKAKAKGKPHKPHAK